MKKYLLCLANSHKYNERCIAGVELNKKENNDFSFVFTGSNVKWIRPISSCEHGELSSAQASRIKLLDIIEVDTIKDCPSGYQSENVLINEESLKILLSISPNIEDLNKIRTKNIERIFLNKGKAVIKDEIQKINSSLIFIKPTQNNFIKVRSKKAEDQLRADFLFKSINYNLPVTDVHFLKEHKNNPDKFQKITSLYFTISLGLEFEGWHFKLIAGVIYF